jgi:hypothetical protein
MAGRTITSIDELQDYLAGVSARADHHAQGVSAIILAIAGAIVLFKEPRREIRVMEREGETGNVLWVYINGKRYALSYRHDTQAVEVRQNNIQGIALASFDNNDSATRVVTFFAGL